MVPPKNIKSLFFCQKARVKTSISGQMSDSSVGHGMAKETEALMSPVTIVQTLSLLTAHYIELIVASFWAPQIHSRGVPQL